MTKDEALKLALEALESKYIVNCGAWRVQQDKAITAIKEALAQEQDGQCKLCTDGCPACDARRLPEQEPVACKECHLKDTVYDLLGDLKVANLKLSVRAKRTWVGLTDEEIDDLSRTMVKGNKSVNWLCQAIEAKLKEKNT